MKFTICCLVLLVLIVGSVEGSLFSRPSSHSAHARHEINDGFNSEPISTPFRPPFPLIDREGEVAVFSDDFFDLDTSIWSHEITLSGGGNWEFEYYTNNRSNSFVNDGILFIQPTFTADTIGGDAALNSAELDLWGGAPADYCTANNFYGCDRTGGAGGNLLNPIQSAALRSLDSMVFKYGRLEISVRMPIGDWIWPAVWLMPRYNQFGQWPASGEVDIIESRGNDGSYSAGGNNQFGSTLHWGVDWQYDQYLKTHATYTVPKGTLHDAFHVYGIYWDENIFYSYIDSDSNRVLTVNFNQTFWERGKLTFYSIHVTQHLQNTSYNNPWFNGTNATPFDQEFYLIMNVAVGGTNGYFPDGVGGKPWSDTSQHAVNDFYAAKSNWSSTWSTSSDPHLAALQVDWVKLTQTKKQQEKKFVKNKLVPGRQ